MKAHVSRLISSLTIALLGLVAFHGSAFALTTETGAICKPYGASNAAGLNMQVNGAFNFSGSSMYVVCPVVRNGAVNATSLTVWVDGNAGAGTMSCWLYSWDYDGTFLGSSSFSATGRFSRILPLTHAQLYSYSSQSVLCYVPNNGGIFDIGSE
jgi:hypothetical protein